MRFKKVIGAVLLSALLLTGCGKGGPVVFVQSVAQLSGLGGIAPGDRFAGVVVSENVAEIQKDGDRTIDELLVREGDDVTEGQALFSYDTDELQLTLDKQSLELEQLKASIENYKAQIKDLEKTKKRVSVDKQLSYTIQIQSLQVDLKEAELNIKAKETEVERSKSILENATVTSPVNGRVQSVSESGTDNYGNPLPYITIQQSGAYRVKGTLGELQRGGILEGDRIRILSRTNPDQFWLGTVTLVDYENPSQGSNMDMYYGSNSDEMTSASKYPFYVELDSTEDLMLGQHVYLELDRPDGKTSGPSIGSAFICHDETDGTSYVWAENRGKLEKRTVTLGAYNEMMDTYEILTGLTAEDYIAFPDPERCREGVATTHEEIIEEEAESLPEGEEFVPEDGEFVAGEEEFSPEAEEFVMDDAEFISDDEVSHTENEDFVPKDAEFPTDEAEDEVS